MHDVSNLISVYDTTTVVLQLELTGSAAYPFAQLDNQTLTDTARAGLMTNSTLNLSGIASTNSTNATSMQVSVLVPLD